jgi:calcineurin-like phosphoesterase family protein
LAFTGLHGIISQNIELLTASAVITSNPTLEILFIYLLGDRVVWKHNKSKRMLKLCEMAAGRRVAADGNAENPSEAHEHASR